MPSTTTTPTVSDLTLRFNQLHEELDEFVQECRDADWIKVTKAEGWPVGVTARHIAAAHYPVIDWVQMIVEGNPLPPVTMETIDQLNAQHAAEHQACTKEEVAELLRVHHAKVIGYLQTINDDDLARQGHLALFGTDVSAAQLFTAILIDIAGGHLASIKQTVS